MSDDGLLLEAAAALLLFALRLQLGGEVLALLVAALDVALVVEEPLLALATRTAVEIPGASQISRMWWDIH